MKRKHEEEEVEHESSERWLLTYSDLITLLLALFIILYSMSSVDLDKLKQLSKYLSESFHVPETQVSNEDIELPDNLASILNNILVNNNSSNSTSGGNASGSGSGDGNTASGLDEIYKELSSYIKENGLDGKIDITKTDTELHITLKDTVLFVPDSPTMLEESKPILKTIEESLVKIYEKIDHITISGHTADVYGEGNKSSAFAWQLSSNRAVTVLNFLKESGLPEHKLSIEGYSHFSPIASNETEEDRAKNRRVEITVRKVAT